MTFINGLARVNEGEGENGNILLTLSANRRLDLAGNASIGDSQ